MKNVLLFFAIGCCCSCSDSFINHSIEFEKTGNCVNSELPVKIISNINGQRYEFENCMDADFDGKNYKVERKGDSLMVSFPNASAIKSQFKLTLDIDAKPEYHHIFLDGKEVGVER